MEKRKRSRRPAARPRNAEDGYCYFVGATDLSPAAFRGFREILDVFPLSGLKAALARMSGDVFALIADCLPASGWTFFQRGCYIGDSRAASPMAVIGRAAREIVGGYPVIPKFSSFGRMYYARALGAAGFLPAAFLSKDRSCVFCALERVSRKIYYDGKTLDLHGHEGLAVRVALACDPDLCVDVSDRVAVEREVEFLRGLVAGRTKITPKLPHFASGVTLRGSGDSSGLVSISEHEFPALSIVPATLDGESAREVAASTGGFIALVDFPSLLGFSRYVEPVPDKFCDDGLEDLFGNVDPAHSSDGASMAHPEAFSRHCDIVSTQMSVMLASVDEDSPLSVFRMQMAPSGSDVDEILAAITVPGPVERIDIRFVVQTNSSGQQDDQA